MVWEMSSWHTLGPLIPIIHCLNATAYLPIAYCCSSLYGHNWSFSNGSFQYDNALCYKANIVSNFHGHYNEFSYFSDHPSHQIWIVEHLWDVVEQEINSMNVQLTNEKKWWISAVSDILRNPCQEELRLFSEQRQALPSAGMVFFVKCTVSHMD